MFKRFTSKFSSAFWILHTTGWMLFLLEEIFRYSAAKGFRYEMLTGRILPVFMCGYAATLLSRYFLRKADTGKMSFYRIVILIFSLSIFSGLVWHLLRQIYYAFMNMGTFSLEFIFDAQYAMLVFSEFIPITLGWHILYFGIKLWMLNEEQKEQTEKAMQLAREAQLEMLRYQLNPHFLFNALNSLYALTSTDTDKAKLMIGKISEFLRYSLIDSEENEVPLNSEIEMIKNYLDIEQTRYGKKLAVHFNIEHLAGEYPVPVFIIHPLVENAVKHGFQTSKLPLVISVNAEVLEDELFISISNTGKWIEPEIGNKKGKGIDNVKKRIAISYPGKNGFQIIKTDELVTVKLNFKKDVKEQ